MHFITDQGLFQHYLKASNYLSCFSFPAEQYAKLCCFESDEFITKEGEEPAHLYFLLSGRVQLFFTLPNGKNTLIDFFDAPCFIGEMELLGMHYQSRAVQALIPCHCFALPMEACKELLLADTLFLRKLCIYVSTKSIRNASALAQAKTFPLANRLAAFLLLAAPNGRYQEKHAKAAEYLGVSYRHLLYVLADFVEKGLLEKTPTGYHIKNKDALARLAGEMKSQLEESYLYADMFRGTN